MTNITITGVVETKKGFNQINRDIKRTSVLFNQLGRSLRDDAKKRITTQDGGQYAPLSKWTKARTGRRKALITERPGITFIAKKDFVLIGHVPSKGSTTGQESKSWNLGMHERGFTTPGSNRPTPVILKRPNYIKEPRPKPGGLFIFRNTKPSVTPARQVFANPYQARAIVGRIARKWLAKILKRAKSK